MGWKLTVRMASTQAPPVASLGPVSASRRRPQLSVVVPAFDEEARIAATVRDLQGVLEERFRSAFEIIIVDDGSRDGTLEAALEAADACPPGVCRVVSYPTNEGKGHALRRGFASAAGDVVAFCDADGEISGATLLSLVDVAGGATSAVVGRRRWQVARPWHRRLASIVLAWFARVAFDLPVPETQAGVKVFVREDVDPILRQCRQDGYLFDLELLARMRREGLRMRSVDIVQTTTRSGRIAPLAGVREVLPAARIWLDLRATSSRRAARVPVRHGALTAPSPAEDRPS